LDNWTIGQELSNCPTLIRSTMTKKVAIVTGSNKGIGLSTVKFLCQKFDGDVFLCSRDKERGEAAVKKLEELGLKPKLAILAIDDDDSVDRLRNFLLNEYGGLDVLVNNAAIAYPHASTVPFIDQARNTLAINYFATESVCDILFPILKPGARVVNVSSSLGLLSRVKGEELAARIGDPILTRHDLDALAYEFIKDVETGAHLEKGWPNSAYSTSKILFSALTWIQHREFKNDPRDIVINAVHPGYVDTDMTNHKGPLTPDQGAQSSVFAALIPANGHPRGAFIWEDCSVVDWWKKEYR